ncbi:MAG: hypothetical protein HYZ81_04255 [Nitrospinae bacterium]|nr:hypothetical protein [Nitrospinota bacterium]
MTGKWWRIATGVCALVSVWCLLGGYATAADWTAVTDERLLNAGKEADNWLMYYRTYDGWRHSPLNQISTQNAAKLVPKWFLALGEVGNQEATPVVNNGIMIFPAGSVRRIQIFAVDAAKGERRWLLHQLRPDDCKGEGHCRDERPRGNGHPRVRRGTECRHGGKRLEDLDGPRPWRTRP